ncbi:MAG: hypothetical protein RJA33_478 [Actinomycetota bacterium]|jgi:competence protein ComEA
MENIKNWWSDLHYTDIQKRSLLIVGSIVLATSGFFILQASSATEPAIAPPLMVDVAAVDIVIDVQGAVVKAGVYTLPLGSRVIDAVKAAGGLSKIADPSDVNQARVLVDGEQIYIYAKSTSSQSGSQGSVKKKPAATQFISINRASAKDFESLDGIGPVLASRIVAYRKSNGSFTAIDDLLKVPGIGKTTLAKFKAKLRV